MADKIQIRMGGYGPATTGFSKSLKFIGDRLEKQFGDRIDVKYVWNIMDFGYRAEDVLWLVESGVLSLGYQSSSYLTDRVPELGFVDLPFLFDGNARARAAMDDDGSAGGLPAAVRRTQRAGCRPAALQRTASAAAVPDANGSSCGRARRDAGAGEGSGPALRLCRGDGLRLGAGRG